jgi:predicted DNA-binding protein
VYNPSVDDFKKGDLVAKQTLDKVSIYVPKSKIGNRPIERLAALAQQQDRSVSYLAVEAILEYLKEEELKD